jgi:hypothetical protein
MNTSKIRLLLWCGCLGAVILFAGDMLYYGGWGSARVWSHDYFLSMMARVASWRLHLGSITGPVGMGCEILGYVGIWLCCRRAAPRLAAVMLASQYANCLFSVLQHGIYGPMGFVIRYCGPDSSAVAQIFKLDGLLTNFEITGWTWSLGSLIWIILTLRGKSGVPRWTVLLAPFITYRVEKVAFWVPAPLGLPLWGGWTNFIAASWFAVLALTYRDQEIESWIAVSA